jgi:hypothetical protein
MNIKDIRNLDDNEDIAEWSEIKADNKEFFKFKKIGDTLTGLLVRKSVSTQYGFGLYTLRIKSKQIGFHGSTQLDPIMKKVNLCEFIEIKLVDEQKTLKGNLKIFIVCVGKH